MRSEDEVWHKHAYDRFLKQQQKQREHPVLEWRHFPSRQYTEVVLCARDEPGLLAKVTHAFTKSDLNIFHAEIYTLKNGVALDILKVTSEGRFVHDESLLDDVVHRLFKNLKDERFHSSPFKPAPKRKAVNPVVGSISTRRDPMDGYTILDLHAPDYLGLLKDVLRIISYHRIDVHEAWIRTEDGWADDIFYLSNLRGGAVSERKMAQVIGEIKRLCL